MTGSNPASRHRFALRSALGRVRVIQSLVVKRDSPVYFDPQSVAEGVAEIIRVPDGLNDFAFRAAKSKRSVLRQNFSAKAQRRSNKLRQGRDWCAAGSV